MNFIKIKFLWKNRLDRNFVLIYVCSIFVTNKLAVHQWTSYRPYRDVSHTIRKPLIKSAILDGQMCDFSYPRYVYKRNTDHKHRIDQKSSYSRFEPIYAEFYAEYQSSNDLLISLETIAFLSKILVSNSRFFIFWSWAPWPQFLLFWYFFQFSLPPGGYK